jgi:ech hydrogenase subunit C
VPGCAARPQAIIDGIVKAIDLWQKKANDPEYVHAMYESQEEKEEKEEQK